MNTSIITKLMMLLKNKKKEGLKLEVVCPSAKLQTIFERNFQVGMASGSNGDRLSTMSPSLARNTELTHPLENCVSFGNISDCSLELIRAFVLLGGGGGGVAFGLGGGVGVVVVGCVCVCGVVCVGAGEFFFY